MNENGTQANSGKSTESKCIICGGLIMANEKVCPLCRAAASASRSDSDSDDTGNLDLGELHKKDSFFITEAGMPLVYIPPGEFHMGMDKHAKSEKPAHLVYLDGYYIGRFPVTNWQFHEYVRESGQKEPPFISKIGYNDPDQPVVGVSWHEALDFCKWLSQKAKKEYSLPTEAQWEKAARGTEGNHYPWGNEKPTHEKAHYSDTLSAKNPAEVTSHPEGASPLGCQDMVGNIWEWTADAYDESYYIISDYVNPEGPTGFQQHVLRGCGRAGRGDFLRCTRRIAAEPDTSTNQSGFRVARKIDTDEDPASGIMRRRQEARTIVRQAKEATGQNRRHQARILIRKALELNPDNKAAKQMLAGLPGLPEGLEPAKHTQYHPETGLPLEAFCEWTGSTMVLVPAGKFIMGSDRGGPDEKPVHEIYLDSFYIDKFEVTNEMFAMFLDMQNIDESKEASQLFESNKHGIIRRGGRWTPAPRLARHPMVCITWFGAHTYAKWASMDLPSEAQWEKAARGTDGQIYPWGNKFNPSLCNCKPSGIMHTTPVRQYGKGLSPCGCWDMAGNVWEWCFDWYAPDYYSSSPDREPLGPPSGEMKVLRSGGWGADAPAVRCSARYYAPPEIHIDTLGGFRCVKLLKPRPPREEYRRSIANKITRALTAPIMGGKKIPDR